MILEEWIIPREATAPPWMYITIAVFAMLITSVSKGGFGGGVGVVAVPLMMQVAPVHFVIGLWLPILLVCDVATIRAYPRQWSPRAAALLAPGMVAGILGATFLLGGMSRETGSPQAQTQEAWLKIAVALIALAFVALRFRPQRPERQKPWRPTWGVSLPVGVLAGVTTTLAHAAGTIITMYLLPQKLDQRVFVGTCGRFYMTFNAFKIPFLWFIGVMSGATVRYGVWLMILSPLGVYLGARLNRRLSATWFERLIYAFLLVATVKLIIDGVRGLSA